ncbi:hypothetical protein [Rhodomicrobium lacus]
MIRELPNGLKKCSVIQDYRQVYSVDCE